MSEELKVAAIVGVGFFAFLVIFGIWLQTSSDAPFPQWRTACEAKGGHLLELRRNTLCLTSDGRIDAIFPEMPKRSYRP